MSGNGTPTRKPGALAIIAAGTIGNALEWYDLFVYGYLAVIIGKIFFPSGSEFTSLLYAVGTFGVSYIMRPLGAAVIGSYADRFGRKAGMTLTIGIMGLGTALMAFTPGYETIGKWAAVLVVIGKFMQGFSAGGEFGTSIAFMIESAPAKRKTFFGSFQFVGIGIATALASYAGIALNTYFTPAELASWAWRLPFIFGLLIVPVGYLIRRGVSETPEFLADATAMKTTRPVADLMLSGKARLIFAIGIYSLSASTNYLLHAYIPTYAMRELRLSPDVSFWGAMLFSIVQIVLTPMIGMLCDRFGKFPFVVVGIVLTGIGTYPAFALMIAHPQPVMFLSIITILAVLVTVFTGPIPTLLAEQFPMGVRTTGLGLVHNLNFTLFGGFAPFICVWLIHWSHDKFVPAYYVLVTAVMAFISVFFFGFRLRAGSHEAGAPPHGATQAVNAYAAPSRQGPQT
ncbi:MFS transporter [Burkholderia sp. WAC0059]|uniref:MFS transporter n=1 Tax=Burkholderia sp. WAC0059 TaxID=2066022 RepID=UPI000C7F588B|nr:MFS transporter [Burkholderia sp. WAC0059]PLZ00594.1 MFS transporter [Burkholderia sp. WAC0059]